MDYAYKIFGLLFIIIYCSAKSDAVEGNRNAVIHRTAFRFPPISPWGSPIWWKLLSQRTVYRSKQPKIQTSTPPTATDTVLLATTKVTEDFTTTLANANEESPSSNFSSSTESLEKTSTKPSPLSSSTENPIHSKRRKQYKEDCRRYENKELYQMLEQVGAYNQRYMAHTPEEAGKRFPSLHETPSINDDVVVAGSPFQPNVFGTMVNTNSLPSSFDSCGSVCRNIERKLSDALKTRLRDNAASWQSPENNSRAELQAHPARNLHIPPETVSNDAADAGPVEIQEGNLTNSDRGCSLDRFIPIGNCTRRGEEELWGYEKLCSACHGIFMLSSKCFPQFFNSISCDKSDTRCIFDWWTTEAHGKCHERTLSFTVMRNLGTEECQSWHYETLNVPTACECYLSKASWLKS